MSFASHSPRSRLRRIAQAAAFMAVLGLVFSVPGLLAKGMSAGEAPARESVSIFIPGAGFLVFIDAETGAILSNPSPAQRAALREVMQAQRASRRADLHESHIGLRTFAVPGGLGVDLQGRFTSSTVLRLQPDGTFVVECVDDVVDEKRLQAKPAAVAVQ